MLDFIQSFIHKPTIIYVGFEDVKIAINNSYKGSSGFILINTLSSMDQTCLIYGTLPIDKEEAVMNEILNQGHKDKWTILLYGRHSADESVVKKRKQLLALGFTRIHIYGGGLFEWLLLQEIYGTTEFPTTAPCKDLLRYRSPPVLSNILPALTY